MSKNNGMPSLKEENVKNSLPGEEEIKQEYITPESSNSSSISIPKFSSKGIEVVATRKGFYNQRRISEGEKFIVKKKENLGEWMKCVDPALERERFNFFKNKKAKK